MNKIIKYSLCIFLTLAVTCSVIFLPYFYYKAADKAASDSFITETFSLDSSKNSLSSEDFVELLSSDEAMWVTQSIDLNTARNEVRSAVISLNNTFVNNDLAQSYLKDFLDVFTEMYSDDFTAVNVSGKIGDSPASVSLLYMQFTGMDYDEDSEGVVTSYMILLDRNTKRVYEFAYIPDARNPAYDEEVEYTDYYKEEYEQTLFDLQSYWGTDREDLIVHADFNGLYFNIMPVGYSRYSFNRYNSAVLEEDIAAQEAGNGEDTGG